MGDFPFMETLQNGGCDHHCSFLKSATSATLLGRVDDGPLWLVIVVLESAATTEMKKKKHEGM